MGRGKKTDAIEINIEDRRAKALDLRRGGASLRRIADSLGVSHEQIRMDIKGALEEAIKENVDNAEQMRTLELERLDDMLLRISEQVRKGDLKAIDRALRISEQRAKLLGLYAPVKADHTGDIAIRLVRESSFNIRPQITETDE